MNWVLLFISYVGGFTLLFLNSLLLCGLFYEAIYFMSYLVLFCSCVFFSLPCVILFLYFFSFSLLPNSLLLCGLFYEAICFMSYLVLFCSYAFSPFSIAITSLGEERANLSAF